MINYQGAGPTGFNMGSPIVNNMMGQQVQQHSQIPNIGNNMMPISPGYNSMMNGYYGQNMPGGGVGYYNPYLVNEQIKARQAMEREKQRSQSSIWKKMSRSANKYTGHIPEDLMDDHVKKFDYQEQTYDEAYYKMEKVKRIYNIANTAIPSEQLAYIRINRMNQEYDRIRRDDIPSDISLNDFLAKCGEILYDIQHEEMKKNRNDASKLYKGDEYHQLLQLHNTNNRNYFSDVFNPVNLDDMEVKLPTSIAQENAEKKKKFFESIFGQDTMMKGAG